MAQWKWETKEYTDLEFMFGDIEKSIYIRFFGNLNAGNCEEGTHLFNSYRHLMNKVTSVSSKY